MLRDNYPSSIRPVCWADMTFLDEVRFVSIKDGHVLRLSINVGILSHTALSNVGDRTDMVCSACMLGEGRSALHVTLVQSEVR